MTAVNPFNPRKPNVARIYDALRDGKDNFSADREAADAIKDMAADGQRAAHDNRAFLTRAVRYLIRGKGVYQFLDIGSGMPADQNTHQIAGALTPRARVAYLDNDPVVTAHGARPRVPAPATAGPTLAGAARALATGLRTPQARPRKPRDR